MNVHEHLAETELLNAHAYDLVKLACGIFFEGGALKLVASLTHHHVCSLIQLNDLALEVSTDLVVHLEVALGVVFGLEGLL